MPETGRSSRKVAKWIRRLIVALTTIPGLWFVWLQFWGTFSNLVQSVPARIIGEFSIILYLMCWLFGTNLELDWLEEFVPEAPGNTFLNAITAGVLLLIFFLPICYLVERESWTGAFILIIVFWSANILSWRFGLVRLMKPQFERASANATTRPFLRARIAVVKKHVIGRWQWTRFIAGGLLAVASVIVARTRLPALIATKYHLPGSQVVLALLLLAFVVAMETWMWIGRVQVLGGMTVIDDLESDGALAGSQHSNTTA
jgi:hypothetical protein